MPQGVAVDPAGSRVYVAEQSASRVAVVNTGTNGVTAVVPVGPSPNSLAIRPLP